MNICVISGVIAQAARHIPTSVRIWIKAADLETETKAKMKAPFEITDR